MATFTKTLKSKIYETKLSEKEYEKILKIVESGEYSSVSDFIQEAIIEYYKRYKEA
ncbi:MAG TPA: ribbon-helix-helix protein, CopG family [Methanosarcinales archaeon]|nr:ribbon-helix-helix protein, CopG family [Methanosarcinales archaeon]